MQQFLLLDIQSKRILNSTTALDLPAIPKSLLVIGGGYIGLELGSVYQALGSKVSVVEMLDGLLPGADRDLVSHLSKRIKEKFEGIKLRKLVCKDELTRLRAENRQLIQALAVGTAAAADSMQHELTRLRAENEKLKAGIEEIRDWAHLDVNDCGSEDSRFYALDPERTLKLCDKLLSPG